MKYSINLVSKDEQFFPTVHGWTSNDPRLTTSRGTRSLLDDAPISGHVPPARIPYIAGYETGSKNYIFCQGQTMYYIDSDFTKPFINQLFGETTFTRQDYVDPMGSYKPRYNLTSFTFNPSTTFMRDSQIHRNDIMSKLLIQNNITSYQLKN